MQYNFSYVTAAATGATVDVSLQITTTDIPASDGSVVVTDVSGTWNGQAVIGLNAAGSFGGNDNLFYPLDNSPDSTSSTGYADFSGFGFSVDTSLPGAIAGDDGSGNVLFFGGSGADGGSDAEYVPASQFGFEPATAETLTPACYCAGTRIRTPQGDVLVEQLTVGDFVVTLDGSSQPVRWIGQRSYAGRFLQGRRELYPIRMRASSLAHGVPSRDLLVSPKHAMYLNGVLVTAADLVNGRTIIQEFAMDRVDYFHVELDHHGIIWAENAASETFVDDGGRQVFQNAHLGTDKMGMHSAKYFTRRVTQGAELESIRQGLHDQHVVQAA